METFSQFARVTPINLYVFYYIISLFIYATNSGGIRKISIFTDGGTNP